MLCGSLDGRGVWGRMDTCICMGENVYICVCVYVCMSANLSHISRVRLFATPLDYSPPGSSVHGILQARILEWVAMLFSRGSSWPRDWTCVSWGSCIAGRFFITEPVGKPVYMYMHMYRYKYMYMYIHMCGGEWIHVSTIHLKLSQYW